MGWYNIVIGMQHTGWEKIQEKCYRTFPHCNKTGMNWASRMQSELWGLVWDLWKHHQDVRLETLTADDIAMLADAKVAAIIELLKGRDTLPPPL